MFPGVALSMGSQVLAVLGGDDRAGARRDCPRGRNVGRGRRFAVESAFACKHRGVQTGVPIIRACVWAFLCAWSESFGLYEAPNGGR